MPPEPDPRADILRAAGHADAADLLERLNGLEVPKPKPQETPQPPAPPMTNERRLGEKLLAGLNATPLSRWSSTTPTGEPAA